MTLIVETGGCALNANAYIDVAYADQYFLDRDNATWAAALTGKKEAAIIKATTFLDARYINRWKGRKEWPLNRLRQWPRVPDLVTDAPAMVYLGIYHSDLEYVFGPNEVPEPVKQACSEAALRALSGELIPDLARGGQIISQAVNLGGLSRSTTWSAGAPAVTTFGLIDGILAPVLARGASMRNVARA